MQNNAELIFSPLDNMVLLPHYSFVRYSSAMPPIRGIRCIPYAATTASFEPTSKKDSADHVHYPHHPALTSSVAFTLSIRVAALAAQVEAYDTVQLDRGLIYKNQASLRHSPAISALKRDIFGTLLRHEMRP